MDEHRLPVARITRYFGPNELLMFKLTAPKLKDCLRHYGDIGLLTDFDTQVTVPATAAVDLIGDHQMGTARMGDNPAESVVDRSARQSAGEATRPPSLPEPSAKQLSWT